MAEYTSSYTGAQIDASVGKFEGSYLKGIHAIQLNTIGDLSGYGGFIDFHYNGSSNYTSRIIEKSSGVLSFDNNISVQGNSYFATDWGNVGIGTTSPSYKLHVSGSALIEGSCRFGFDSFIDKEVLHLEEGSNLPTIELSHDGIYAYLRWEADGDGLSLNFDNGADEKRLHVYGYIIANSITQLSDIRKKNIIGNITMDVNDIANAPLFKFTWKDERMKGEHVGSSAQYWQEILPEAISVDKDPMQSLSMDYSTIALASAITTAKSVVDHEERIAALEKENALLKKEIEAIKAA